MLLERDGQLRTLHDRLEHARDGTGSMVLLGGEAGAGKTTLVQAFVDALPSSVEVCHGVCDPLTTPRPLGPLRDLATASSGPIAGLDIGDGDRTAVFQAALGRLRDAGIVVMVIEDLHWADQATLDFVTYLARRIDTTTTVAIVTFRDDEVGVEHPARTAVGHLSTLASTQRITAPPLSLDAVSVVAADLGVDPVELHRTTAGNAFFVTEVVATGSALPDTVQDAVLARVAQLSEAEQAVVRAVSIAPRSLDLELATEVAGVAADDVDGAVSAGALVTDGDDLRFRHELARAAIEQSILPASRRAMHSAMLAVLLDRRASDPALLAHHAIRARSPDLIVEHAPIAATEARNRGALRESAAFVRSALEHETMLGDDRAARLRLDLAQDLVEIDDADQAIDVARTAGAHFRRVGDAEGEAAALLLVGIGLGRTGRVAEANATYTEAANRLEALGPSEMLARALAQVASGAMLARQVERGRETAERARQIAERSGSAATQRSIRHVLACLELIGGDPDHGLSMLQASVEENQDDPSRFVLALVNLGTGAGEVRRYDVALDALRRAEHFCSERDLDDSTNYVRAWLARVAFEQGRWDDAVIHAEQVDRLAVNRAGYAVLTALTALGRVRVRRGDPDGRALLERSLDDARGHNLQHVWSAASGIAEACWLDDDHDAAVAVVGPLFERALDTDSVWAQGELGFWMWRAGAIDDAPEGAAGPFALQIGGDWRGAAEAWNRIGAPYEVGLALADGDIDARLEAIRVFDDLGARPIADRIRTKLRTDGVEGIPRGPATGTRDHPLGLTPRQDDVLRLMVEGLSNGEIAERLYVSKKTVEHHVSAVFTKLGVATRAQAIAAAHRV